MYLQLTNAEALDTSDLKLFVESLQRLTLHGDPANVNSATLHISPRRPSGWLEYLLAVEWVSGGRITIGCIQRTVGAECEFHS